MDFNKLCCVCHERLYIKYIKQKFLCFGGSQRILHTYDCGHVIHSECVYPGTPCPICEGVFSPEEMNLLYSPIITKSFVWSLSFERATVIFKIALEREKMDLVEELLLYFLFILQKNASEIKTIMTLINSKKWDTIDPQLLTNPNMPV